MKDKKFSDLLLDWRSEKRLNQKNAAFMLGISLRAYQAYETDERKPKKDVQAAILRSILADKPEEIKHYIDGAPLMPDIIFNELCGLRRELELLKDLIAQKDEIISLLKQQQKNT